MGHFHRRVRVGSVCKGTEQFAISPPKVGVIQTELYGAVLVSNYSAVGLLRRQYLNKLNTPSVHWSTESLLLSDRGIITNQHSTRKVFLDNGESFVD